MKAFICIGSLSLPRAPEHGDDHDDGGGAGSAS